MNQVAVTDSLFDPASPADARQHERTRHQAHRRIKDKIRSNRGRRREMSRRRTDGILADRRTHARNVQSKIDQRERRDQITEVLIDIQTCCSVARFEAALIG